MLTFIRSPVRLMAVRWQMGLPHSFSVCATQPLLGPGGVIRSSLRGSLVRAAIDPIINAVAVIRSEPQATLHQIERLEPRQLLDAIPGSSGDDIFVIEYQSDVIPSILKKSQSGSFSEPVNINGGGGNDRLIIHFNTGAAFFDPDATSANAGTISH